MTSSDSNVKASDAGQSGPILRIADMLRRETNALRHFAPCDIAQNNALKSQALLELVRHGRTLKGIEPTDTLRHAIETLQLCLRENGTALQLHLGAARAVTSLMVDAIAREDSDRTYQRLPPRVAQQ